MYPGSEYYANFFSTSVDQRYEEIGQNRMTVASSLEHFDQLIEQVFSTNDVVFLANTLFGEQRAKGNWYRSDEPVT